MATPSSSYLVSRADRAEMEQGVARRDFAPATVLCRPARIDLGVLAVLAHIGIKKRPAGGETWHDEVGFLRAAVGERAMTSSRNSASLMERVWSREPARPARPGFAVQGASSYASV